MKLVKCKRNLSSLNLKENSICYVAEKSDVFEIDGLIAPKLDYALRDVFNLDKKWIGVANLFCFEVIE